MRQFPKKTERGNSIYLLETTEKNMVGESRFELPTSCSQGRRANQAALLPESNSRTFIPHKQVQNNRKKALLKGIKL